MLTPKILLATLLAATPLSIFADERTDRRIEESARSSHTFQRVLNNEIDVKVRDGVATLSGEVSDMDQARLAEDTVATIEGVRRVDNRIKLDPTARGASDEWLAVKIRSKLLLKRDISLSHTRVNVRDGIVTLTGTAESPAQKARTESAIREIAGVRQVKNHLEIAERTAERGRAGQPAKREPSLPPGAGLPTGRESPRVPDDLSRQPIEDAAVTSQVRFQLLTNDQTSALEPKIDTAEGRVTIAGVAESDAQRDLVTELARRVRGVAHVENRMTVKRR